MDILDSHICCVDFCSCPHIRSFQLLQSLTFFFFFYLVFLLPASKNVLMTGAVIPLKNFLCCSTGGASHVWLTWPECEAGTCTFSQAVYVKIRCGAHARFECLVPRHMDGCWLGVLKDEVQNPSWKFHTHQGRGRVCETICTVIATCWSDYRQELKTRRQTCWGLVSSHACLSVSVRLPYWSCTATVQGHDSWPINFPG